MLTTPNLDVTGHHWVGALVSYEFTLEYQKGSDNAATDALSHVPVRHNKDMVRLLLEGVATTPAERGEVLISWPLRVEHNHLGEESRACALKLAPMHMTNWEEAQSEEAWLDTCHKWMSTKKDVPPQKRDTTLRTCIGNHWDSEEGKALFHVRNSLAMKKGMLYVNITPKVKIEGLLAFVVPNVHPCTTLNGVHWDAGY